MNLLDFFFPVLDIVFDFWPVLIITSIQGRKNALRNMTYTWGLWAMVRIFLLFSPEPLPSLWMQEPLNTLLFSMAGVILIGLWIGSILWRKAKTK